MDNFYIATGAIGALIGGAYMIYSAIKHPYLWTAARGVYLLAGLLDIYLMVIYILALVHVLGIPGYGVYVRPVLLPIVLSPAAVAFIQRRLHG
jgi:hypothetical protein